MSDYPWPLNTYMVTAAAMADILDELKESVEPDRIGIIGPLSLRAMVELLYRVKKVRFQASGTHSTEGTATYDEILELANVTNELERFADCAYNPDTPLAASSFVDSTPFGRLTLLGSSSLGRSDSVFHATDANNFYIYGEVFTISNTPSSMAIFFTTNHRDIIAEPKQEFQANIILACGTFQTSMTASAGTTGTISASAVTLRATEWFPFAHPNGSPFWDTTTGEYLSPV